MNQIAKFFSKPIFQNPRFIYALWVIVAIAASSKRFRYGVVGNNYLIFKYTFVHSLEKVNLYLQYPDQCLDSNHYGPFFALLIAPFTLLPDLLGNTIWNIAMASTAFIAIYYLQIPKKWKLVLYYVPLSALFNCGLQSQTTPLIAALIIGTLICLRKEKEFWAACFIVMGFYIKLYGVVGLSFFFFSKHKLKFIAYLVFWSVVLFALPMIISSPSFVVQSYQDWFDCLVHKNAENLGGIYSDYSAIGLIRKTTDWMDMPMTYILGPALVIFALQYIRIKEYANWTYQLAILASALMFVVLFSTGSENPSYFIALIGVSIWFCIQDRPYNKATIIFFILIVALTELASIDVLPRSITQDICSRYSLKALPSLIVWLVLAYQVIINKDLYQNKIDEAK